MRITGSNGICGAALVAQTVSLSALLGTEGSLLLCNVQFAATSADKLAVCATSADKLAVCATSADTLAQRSRELQVILINR